MRPKLRVVLSWLAVGLGFFVGVFSLARFGMWWVPFGDDSPGWFLRWLIFAGIGLLGLGFLVGSVLALRSRRHAGIVFLLLMPVAAFSLAYPDAGFLVWHADGSGWFETPLPLMAIGLTALFFLPFVLPLFTLRRKKRAAAVFAGAALVAAVVFAHSRWTTVLVPRLAGWSAPFLLFGLFWLWTHKLGWAPLVQPRPRVAGGRLAATAIACLLVLSLDIALTLGLSALGSSLFSGDCIGKPPFTHPLSASHAVFTARVIFAGRSLEALTSRLRRSPDEFHDRRVGDWAIGVVQERFWGLPSWGPHLVLLTNFIYWNGETYFIDGSRQNGLLTRELPIVEAGINCSRSQPAQDAVVDLRLLREAPPAGGTRLIGYVKQPEVFTGVFARPTPPSFATGARISVTGTIGTKTITTDNSGIYQLDGLPPGDYTLQLAVPDNQVAGFFGYQGSRVKVHLDNDGLVEHNFDLFWNGRIEGHVKDDSGKPAHVGVMVLNADRSRLPGYVEYFLMTTVDGSYELKKIPPGRYILMINPLGPSNESPYGIEYYPSGTQFQEAQVLELGAGQEIKGIDFTVPRLADFSTPPSVTR